MRTIDLPFTLREVEAVLARRSFRNFVAYTKRDYEFNWHHELICKKLDDFANKKIKRLMIFVPPRNGKSELASRRLPAYIFGKNPNARIIFASYGAELSSLFNRDVQRIIDDPAYAEIFPKTKLKSSNVRNVNRQDYLRNSDTFEIVNHTGSYRSSGVGGAITGMGGDYLILDDPYKNSKEAESPTVRRVVKEWYTSTFYTRQEKNASILIIQTRWHEDDLSGWLLEEQKKGQEYADEWEVISLPAIMDDDSFLNKLPEDPRDIGDALWPNKYSKEFLMVTKSTLGTRQFSALFQQNPKPGDGTIIKNSWLQYYHALPDHFEKIIQSWDMSFSGKETSDYVVGSVYGLRGSKIYLLDQIRAQMDFPETIKAFKNLSNRWPNALTKLIEAKANGQAVIDTLKKEMSGIIAITPTESKVSRLNSVSAMYEAGNIIYPHQTIAPWIQAHADEVMSFPLAKNDDRVDAETQALNYFNRPGIGTFVDDMVTNGTLSTREGW